jgi:hypothetical protein
VSNFEQLYRPHSCHNPGNLGFGMRSNEGLFFGWLRRLLGTLGECSMIDWKDLLAQLHSERDALDAAISDLLEPERRYAPCRPPTLATQRPARAKDRRHRPRTPAPGESS